MSRIIKITILTLFCGMIIVWSISIVATKIALIMSFILLFVVAILAACFKVKELFSKPSKKKKRFHHEYNL